MPIYERRCLACDTVFSHLSKLEDREKAVDCPNCEQPSTKPILSPTRTDFTFADRSPIK